MARFCHAQLFLIFTWALTLGGCSFYKEKGSTGGAEAVGNDLTYATVSSRVLEPKCTTCHSPTGGIPPELDSYAKVINQLARIEARALVDKTMPPRAPFLSATDSEILTQWIRAGAPERGSTTPTESDTGTDTGTGTDPIPAPTFTQLNREIFSKRCATCHDGDSIPALNTYADFIESGYVVKGKHNESSLYERITRPAGARGLMPPRVPLPQEQIDLIRSWIEAGAPEGEKLD